MAFIAGAIMIGAGVSAVTSIAGGAMAAKGAKKAGDTAAAGSQAEIEYNRESRDLARADQAPYQKAGVTALNALMSMTGLGNGAAPTRTQEALNDPNLTPEQRAWHNQYQDSSRLGDAPSSQGERYNIPEGVNAGDYMRERYASGVDAGVNFGAPTNNPFQNRKGRAMGGPMGGGMYNINEMGPENVYSGGAMIRNPNPMTIDGQTGYVQPNIQGRANGGFMAERRYSPPQPGGPGVMPGRLQMGPQTSGGAVKPPFGQQQESPPQMPPQNPGIANGGVMENPGGVEGGYNFMTDPGYNFRFNEGARGLERSAAARGGLLSGGFGKAMTRYGQDYASNEYGNVYNRISNIAGLGQVAAGQSGGYAMNAGQLMGNAAQNASSYQAAGQIGAGNAWANAGNQIAQMPWGNVFKGSQPSGALSQGSYLGSGGGAFGLTKQF